MKILIVRMWPYTLNIKSYNCQEIGLAKALIRKGNICDIVLYTDKECDEEDIIFDDNRRIHIYYLRAKNILKNAIFENKLYDIVKNYDVVQTAEYDQIGNVKLRKKIKNRMVIYHGPYSCEYTKGYKKKCIFSDLYYIFNKDYKNTPCLSKSILATDLLKKKGFKRITTVGVGLDTARFNNEIKNNKDIENLITEKEKNNYQYLLYIGKIEDRRNIMFLIDILKNICEKKSNIKLIMVGKGEKDYIEKCFNYAKNIEVYDNIIYFESMKQEELPNLYKCCDLFLLPTQYEIFGMVLLEAMYFGLPVITTLNGGSSTLIKNNETGMICSLNNVKEWEDAIFNILNDKNLKNTISNNCIKQINENYTWDKLADKFLKVYREGVNLGDKNAEK